MDTAARTTEGGVSLVTTLVAVAIFTLIALALTASVSGLIKGSGQYRESAVIASLADQYLEIARNLPYAEIGTLAGNPHGSLPDEPNAAQVTDNGTTYDIYYVVTYVDDPADGTIALGTDPSPNDYKQVKLYVKDDSTGETTQFETTIAPKGLEGLENGGALSIQVFDASGEPVPNASLHITNSVLSPALDLTRTTDASGNWIEVGLPDSVSSYHIVATKSGYSSDQTYPSSVSNPNPTKPDATIGNGAVTALSFAIDKESSVDFHIVDGACQAISSVGLELKGSKLIGTSPDVLKFDQSYTSDGSGDINISSIEWDNYTPTVTSVAYMVYGSSPIQQISVLPGTSEQSTLILGPSTANSLLVIVKDATTGQPIEGASVTLSSTSTGYSSTKYTEGSVWNQQDWTGGSGQADLTDPTRYWSDDGNVDVSTLPTGVRLRQFFGSYVSSAVLESSAFDTGTASTSYTTLSWTPTSQSASTSIAFQLATNNDDATWNYLGPDGTQGTYYTVPGTTINAITANNRYVRYKLYLTSTDASTTPVLASVDINYVSGCAAPGQAFFAGLMAASDYDLTVSKVGYQSLDVPALNVSGYGVQEALLQQ